MCLMEKAVFPKVSRRSTPRYQCIIRNQQEAKFLVTCENAAERYKDFWPELRRMVYREMIDHGIDPHCCFSDKDISSFA